MEASGEKTGALVSLCASDGFELKSSNSCRAPFEELDDESKVVLGEESEGKAITNVEITSEPHSRRIGRSAAVSLTNEPDALRGRRETREQNTRREDGDET